VGKFGDVAIRFFNAITDDAPKQDKEAERQKKYVFYGEDNLFPKDLVTLMDNSALHGAALDKKALFIAGEGLEFVSEQQQRADAATQFFEEATKGLQEFHNRTSRDKAIFNGFGWQLMYAGGNLAELHHRDFTTIRATKMGASDVEIQSFHVSNDWGLATPKRFTSNSSEWYKPEIITAYNALESHSEPEILYSRGYKPGKLFYPEPTYLGGLRWIEIDAELSSFIKEDIIQGFTGTVRIHVFSTNADDSAEMNKLEGRIIKKWTGSKGQRIVMTASQPGVEKPDIEAVQRNSNEKVMTFIAETVDQKIMLADQMPPRLINKAIATGLASEGTDQKETMQIFQNTVIQPPQSDITAEWGKVLQLAGFEGVEAKIKDLTPISFNASDALREKTETINEIRKSNGKEEIDGGDVFPSGQITLEDGNNE
jgi:hypothetical protein